MKKPNKTLELGLAVNERINTLAHPGGPDCKNRHPGTGWTWSPSQTATKAIPSAWRSPCWHGSAPTPGTQIPAELAQFCAAWLRDWTESNA